MGCRLAGVGQDLRRREAKSGLVFDLDLFGSLITRQGWPPLLFSDEKERSAGKLLGYRIPEIETATPPRRGVAVQGRIRTPAIPTLTQAFVNCGTSP